MKMSRSNLTAGGAGNETNEAAERGGVEQGGARLEKKPQARLGSATARHKTQKECIRVSETPITLAQPRPASARLLLPPPRPRGQGRAGQGRAGRGGADPPLISRPAPRGLPQRKERKFSRRRALIGPAIVRAAAPLEVDETTRRRGACNKIRALHRARSQRRICRKCRTG